MRERRSLWGSISLSQKVRHLSLKAALVYTWAIPHFDDEGFQEGTPQILKAKVVPVRDDIPLEEMKGLIVEILLQKLWKMYHCNGTAFIQDPVWNERQTFHSIHQEMSKIKEMLIKSKTPESVFVRCDDGVNVVLGRCISKTKLSKEKRSKEKGSEEGKNKIPISLSFENKTPSKNLDPVSRKAELKRQAQELGVKP